MTIRTLDGRNPNRSIPGPRITLAEALRCSMQNNAQAMFARSGIGRIAPGTLTNLTIFDGKVIHERKPTP